MANKPAPTYHRAPQMRYHSPSGQYRITLNGQDVWLGTDHAAAKKRCAVVIAEWHLRGCQPPPPPAADVTVAELFDRFAVWASDYYRNSPATFRSIVAGWRPFLDLYGDTPAAKIGPKALKAFRAGLVRDDFRVDPEAPPRPPVRNTINQRIRELVRAFRWAASEELIPASVPEALGTIEPLRMGRSEARESRKVGAVPWEHVEMTLPFLTRPVRDLVLLAWHTGCRIGEILPMCPGDIDRSGNVWEYRPLVHKNAWRGKGRTVLIGPKAQDIIRPRLLRTRHDEPLFSPREVPQERREKATVHRRENQADNPRKSGRTLNAVYTSADVTRAIRRGVDSLNAERRAKGQEPIERWTIHQCRHAFACRTRAEFGAELARVALGHTSLNTTEIYLEADIVMARTVAERMG